MNRQVRKMGGVSKLVSALPGGDKASGLGQVDEGALDAMEVIINSMTKASAPSPSCSTAVAVPASPGAPASR